MRAEKDRVIVDVEVKRSSVTLTSGVDTETLSLVVPATSDGPFTGVLAVVCAASTEWVQDVVRDSLPPDLRPFRRVVAKPLRFERIGPSGRTWRVWLDVVEIPSII